MPGMTFNCPSCLSEIDIDQKIYDTYESVECWHCGQVTDIPKVGERALRKSFFTTRWFAILAISLGILVTIGFFFVAKIATDIGERRRTERDAEKATLAMTPLQEKAFNLAVADARQKLINGGRIRSSTIFVKPSNKIFRENKSAGFHFLEFSFEVRPYGGFGSKALREYWHYIFKFREGGEFVAFSGMCTGCPFPKVPDLYLTLSDESGIE